MSKTSERMTLALSSVGHAYSHLFMLIYATVVLVLEHEFAMPYADLAWLALPGFVIFGLGSLPAGWLGDHWSNTGMMTVYFFGLGAASILTGTVDTPMGLLLGLGLMGLFASIYHPVGIPLIVKNAQNVGRALGFNGVFGSGGTAAAAITAGFLADQFGWRSAFIVPGVICLATGLIFVAAVRRGLVHEAEADASGPLPAASAADRKRVFTVLVVTVLCTGLIYHSLSVGLPKIFSERLPDLAGEGALGAGMLVSLVYAISALGQIIGGELSDRYPIKWVYFGTYFLQVPAMVVAFTSHSPVLVVAVALMVSSGLASQPAENTLLARFTPPKWRGRAFGFKFVLALGVSSVGVAMVPMVHGMTGSLDFLFVLLIGFAVVAAFAALGIPNTPAPKQEITAAE